MGRWYYYDNWGNKQGPVSDQELRFYVVQQKITPETLLEAAENGQQGKARQVPGLFPNGLANQQRTMVREPAAKGDIYSISGSPQAVSPQMNPQTASSPLPRSVPVQPMPQPAAVQPILADDENLHQNKSRLLAAFLAFYFGYFGIHKFYTGQIGWGVAYLVTTLISPILAVLAAAMAQLYVPGVMIILAIAFGILACIPSLISFVEGIIYLCIKAETFQERWVA